MQSRYLSFFLDSLLAAGLLLSLETQLRPSASGVGPGELCLVAWEFPFIILLLLRNDIVVPRACREVLQFWTVFALALSLGATMSIALGEILDISLVVHDIVAYLLLASISILMTLSLPSPRIARVEWLFVIFGAVSLLLQAANTLGWYALPNIDPWYWERVRGWCDNPNQLALLCLLLALLALHLAERARRFGSRLLAITCTLIAVAYGWFSASNDYHVVVVIAASLFSAMKILRCVVAAKPKILASIFVACIVALPPLSVIAFASNDDLSRQIGSFASGLVRADASSDLALREDLWVEGLSRGADAFMLGFGPGPHLSIPGIILSNKRADHQPVNLQSPVPGIAANFETHNTIIELFVQSGILGVVSFLWLGAVAVLRSFKAGHDGLTTALCSLAIFGNSGVIFRFPGVWFVMLVALTLTSRRAILLVAAVTHYRWLPPERFASVEDRSLGC
jgi:O-antigen ligase